MERNQSSARASRSRLFQAVVGVGITLAGASAACFGSTDPPADPSTAPGATESATGYGPRGDDASNDAPAPDATTADATPDVVTPIDAGADVVLDAPPDAFCDASWPTTKGDRNGPTCGPVADCKDAGVAPFCVPVNANGSCDSNGPGVAWCMGGRWQCSTNTIPSDACKCFVGQPGCP